MNEIQLDFGREDRVGFPEFVYGESKTADQISSILEKFLALNRPVFVSRVSEEKAKVLTKKFPKVEYHSVARTLKVGGLPPQKNQGTVGVLAAGTSDAPVAWEALETLHFLGIETMAFCDVGISGLHRLQNILPELKDCQVLICIAGFEGALPSVLGGLVPQPIIAVPTSVGYGVSDGGRVALHAMLSSCASGITVVNIDSGFNAAIGARRILRSQVSGHS